MAERPAPGGDHRREGRGGSAAKVTRMARRDAHPVCQIEGSRPRGWRSAAPPGSAGGEAGRWPPRPSIPGDQDHDQQHPHPGEDGGPPGARPAATLSDVSPIEPPTGRPRNSPLATLATPWARKSRDGSLRRPSGFDATWLTPAPCTSTTAATATTVVATERSVCRGRPVRRGSSRGPATRAGSSGVRDQPDGIPAEGGDRRRGEGQGRHRAQRPQPGAGQGQGQVDGEQAGGDQRGSTRRT